MNIILVNPSGIYDCCIPTKNRSNIRVNLIWLLQVSKKWVRNIVVETSNPLSTARKCAAEKSETQWIAFFDDDTEISEEWFEKATSLIAPGVLAISSMYEEQNPHMRAYLDFFYSFKKHPEEIETANLNTLLIKRSVFEEYNPPAIFHGEDNFLYNFVTARGKWLHFNGLAKHWLSFRSSNFESGVNAKRYELVASVQSMNLKLIKLLSYRFVIPVLILGKTKSWKTVGYFWRWNVQFIAGYLSEMIR